MDSTLPLHLALMQRNLTEMRRLLTADSSYINNSYVNITNTTIFDQALYFGWLPESQLLFSFGAQTMLQSALNSSVSSQNLDLVKWVYANVDSDLSNRTGSLCEKAMSKNNVLEQNKYRMVEYLLSIGLQNTDTLGHYAIIFNLQSIVKLLIDRNLLNMNVIVDLPDRTLTVLLELRNLPHPYTQYLKPDKSNDLFVGITTGNMSMVLASTNDVNEFLTESVGNPLMYAFSKGNLAAINYLLSKGANVTSTTPLRKNCLHFACNSDNTEAVLLARNLLSNTAIDAVYKDHRSTEFSPLTVALSNGYLNSLNSLLFEYNGKQGANVNLYVNAYTPLFALSYYTVANKNEMTNLLVSNGAESKKKINSLK
jgi:hypothetical protein